MLVLVASVTLRETDDVPALEELVWGTGGIWTTFTISSVSVGMTLFGCVLTVEEMFRGLLLGGVCCIDIEHQFNLSAKTEQNRTKVAK